MTAAAAAAADDDDDDDVVDDAGNDWHCSTDLMTAVDARSPAMY